MPAFKVPHGVSEYGDGERCQRSARAAREKVIVKGGKEQRSDLACNSGDGKEDASQDAGCRTKDAGHRVPSGGGKEVDDAKLLDRRRRFFEQHRQYAEDEHDDRNGRDGSKRGECQVYIIFLEDDCQ